MMAKQTSNFLIRQPEPMIEFDIWITTYALKFCRARVGKFENWNAPPVVSAWSEMLTAKVTGWNSLHNLFPSNPSLIHKKDAKFTFRYFLPLFRKSYTIVYLNFPSHCIVILFLGWHYWFEGKDEEGKMKENIIKFVIFHKSRLKYVNRFSSIKT